MKRASLLAILGLFCIPAPAFAQEVWKVVRDTDPMTDEEIVMLGVVSTSQEGQIYFSCNTEGKLDAIVGLRYIGGIGRYDRVPVEYRIDKGEVTKQNWNISTTKSAAFAPKPKEFLETLKTATERLVMRITKYDHTAETHEFVMEGFADSVSVLACAQ